MSSGAIAALVLVPLLSIIGFALFLSYQKRKRRTYAPHTPMQALYGGNNPPISRTGTPAAPNLPRPAGYASVPRSASQPSSPYVAPATMNGTMVYVPIADPKTVMMGGGADDRYQDEDDMYAPAPPQQQQLHPGSMHHSVHRQQQQQMYGGVVTGVPQNHYMSPAGGAPGPPPQQQQPQFDLGDPYMAGGGAGGRMVTLAKDPSPAPSRGGAVSGGGGAFAPRHVPQGAGAGQGWAGPILVPDLPPLMNQQPPPQQPHHQQQQQQVQYRAGPEPMVAQVQQSGPAASGQMGQRATLVNQYGNGY
ncbi:hypothetical protein BC828DRAFT_375498 [Blastocladiella britannica]|nr:hypothetical protein BC828DRAFT_375498 [Blastocladiella britannica]